MIRKVEELSMEELFRYFYVPRLPFDAPGQWFWKEVERRLEEKKNG
jgi:hypothetical protein